MTIRLVQGNLLKSQRHTLTNTVNCVGVMGKGIALDFRKAYPDMFDDYVRRCDARQVQPGQPYLYELSDGRAICNFPTKSHWRSGSRLEWVDSGLELLRANLQSWGVQSLALPPLGCGHGGLDWDDVEPLIRRHLEDVEIPVDVYVPQDVPADPPDELQLALDF